MLPVAMGKHYEKLKPEERAIVIADGSRWLQSPSDDLNRPGERGGS